jgi:phage FluMu protein Com
LTFLIDMGMLALIMRAEADAAAEEKRCPNCRTKIVVPDGTGLVVRNAILRVTRESGGATAKCPRCKTWVEVPLRYSG